MILFKTLSINYVYFKFRVTCLSFMITLISFGIETTWCTDTHDTESYQTRLGINAEKKLTDHTHIFVDSKNSICKTVIFICRSHCTSVHSSAVFPFLCHSTPRTQKGKKRKNFWKKCCYFFSFWSFIWIYWYRQDLRVNQEKLINKLMRRGHFYFSESTIISQW